MMVIADNKKRVTLPAKPGERFDVQTVGDEKIILTRLAPGEARTAKVTFKKVGGFTVGELGHPINEAALKEALAEFP
jgi:hypothetical protein